MNEKTVFQPLNIEEKKLPAFEKAGMKSSLINPVSPVYLALKKLLIKSAAIPDLESLLECVYNSLSPCIKDLSLHLINMEGVVKNIGTPLEATEQVFDLIWEKKPFGIKNIVCGENTRVLIFGVFRDDTYIMVSAPADSLADAEDQKRIMVSLKNLPALFGNRM